MTFGTLGQIVARPERTQERIGLPLHVTVGTYQNAPCNNSAFSALKTMVPSKSALLESLSDQDNQLLNPILQRAHLKQGDVLMIEGRQVDRVCFPVDAVISLLITTEEGKTIETTTVGRDGATAVTQALDSRVSLSRAVVKVGGQALVCEPTAFKRAVLAKPSLLSAMMRHEHTMFAQTQQVAACRATHEATQQLARMLLRTRDLTGGNVLPLTQGFIAELLGMRRTTITDAAQKLQQKGIIGYSRGKIEVLSVQRLRQASCECYDLIKRNYQALLRLEHTPD